MQNLKITDIYVEFEILTVVVMKNIIFWDIMTCSLLKVKFATCCHTGILLGLSFGPEDGR
jgi:hypothetical protein